MRSAYERLARAVQGAPPLRFAAILGHEAGVRTLAALILALLLAAPARAESVHEALDAYALYQRDIGALLDLEVDDAEAVDGALERAARHNPAALSRGWIAYGALTAAQSPAFAAGVQSRVRAAGRAPVLRQLRRDLSYARRRPPGSAEAIGLILAAAGADSARLNTAGLRFAGLGEALDASAWAISERGAREARLRRTDRASLPPEWSARLRIGALAAAPLTDADAFGGGRFWDALAGRASNPAPVREWRERRAHAATTDRMLTLAALVIVGAADGEAQRVNAVLDDPRTSACLTMEQLQFRQCASVARDANEDALCLARHGLAAPGACLGALVQ
jgi:hypothetical protein